MMDNNQKKNTRNKWIALMNIPFQMGITIGGGTFLGIWLDKKYPNNFSGFTIGCALVSIFISLYLTFKQLQKINSK